MSSPALIQIVDDTDRPIGVATKQEAWEKGLTHRVSRIMIENPQGQLLLQHRSPTKDIFPDCWDNSVAGHVDAGENYEAAAKRELEEELGITDLPLQRVGRYFVDETWRGLRMKRFATTYKAVIDHTPTTPEPDKIDRLEWFSVEDARRLIKEHPDKTTDGLRQVLERYY